MELVRRPKLEKSRVPAGRVVSLADMSSSNLFG
jgi:hypothetical protein